MSAKYTSVDYTVFGVYIPISWTNIKLCTEPAEKCNGMIFIEGRCTEQMLQTHDDACG